MEKGGVGALELVAMDMKARLWLRGFLGNKICELSDHKLKWHSSIFRGMYVCRTLSYKGAEFEVVEVPLEANMMVRRVIRFLLFIHFLVFSPARMWKFYHKTISYPVFSCTRYIYIVSLNECCFFDISIKPLNTGRVGTKFMLYDLQFSIIFYNFWICCLEVFNQMSCADQFSTWHF